MSTTGTSEGSSGGLDGSAGEGHAPSSTTSTTSTTSSGATGGTSDVDASALCPEVYAPVCGKDGETYDSACAASHAGVEIRREGPCLGDCEGSCVVAPQGPSLVALGLLVLALLRPRRARPPR